MFSLIDSYFKNSHMSAASSSVMLISLSGLYINLNLTLQILYEARDKGRSKAKEDVAALTAERVIKDNPVAGVNPPKRKGTGRWH